MAVTFKSTVVLNLKCDACTNAYEFTYNGFPDEQDQLMFAAGWVICSVEIHDSACLGRFDVCPACVAALPDTVQKRLRAVLPVRPNTNKGV